MRIRNWSQVYLAVSLTTLATLILELSLTRIFSVIFFYHFAFLAISVALFGLGLGGVVSYLLAGRKGDLLTRLGILAALNGVVVVVALKLVLVLGSDVHLWTLAAVYFVSATPFLLAGAVLSMAIADTIERVDRVYFFDLLGAAAGCLLLIPLLDSLGGPSTLIAAGALFAASSALWFHLAGARGWRAAGLALSAALLLLAIVNVKGGVIDLKYAKGKALDKELFVKWNSFSRIGVNKEDTGELVIKIDADASTNVVQTDLANLSPSKKQELLFGGPGIPYLLHPAAKTLVIGPGGGEDVFRSLASGSRDVTAVEINPIIATDIMRGRYKDETYGIYLRPEVRVFVEDGRSFVRRSQEKYDVIQATLVDTWASTAAGAFALSENNLYTVDAFQDYLSHLTDGGLLVFTRWGFEPPRESLRLLSLAREALGQLGESASSRHIIVLRDAANLNTIGARDTVLVFRKPLSPDQVAHFRELLQPVPLTQIYMPGDAAANPFGQLLLSEDPANFERNYTFDVTPVTDDRPFFFYTTQARDAWGLVSSFIQGSRRQAPKDLKINVAVPLLYGALFVSLIATTLMLVFPPLVLGNRLPRERGVFSFLLFFLAIGTGYILIEVALIQKFIVFLGHPTYALVVIVFSMLVFSGIGSYLSSRLLRNTASRLQVVLAVVSLLVILLALAVRPATAAGMAWPLPLRALITTLMIAPVAFFMGMPFPTGLKLLENLHKPSVRWAWSLNAAASVLGSVGAIFLAIYLGLSQTMIVGGGMYFCALVLVYLGVGDLAPGRTENIPLASAVRS